MSPDGKSSNEVLCIDTNVREGDGGGDDDHEWRVSTIPIRRHEGDADPPDLRYKCERPPRYRSRLVFARCS